MKLLHTKTKSGWTTRPISTTRELEKNLLSAYRRRRVAIARDEERRIIGEACKSELDGKWTWWYEIF